MLTFIRNSRDSMVNFVDRSSDNPKASGLVSGAGERVAIAGLDKNVGQLISGTVQTMKAWNNRGFRKSYWSMLINEPNTVDRLRNLGLQSGDNRSVELQDRLQILKETLGSKSLEVHLHDDDSFNDLKANHSINRPEPKSAIPLVNWLRAISRIGEPKRPMVVHMPKSDLTDPVNGARNFILHFAPAVLNLSEREARQLADLVADKAGREAPMETPRRVHLHEERADGSAANRPNFFDRFGTSGVAAEPVHPVDPPPPYLPPTPATESPHSRAPVSPPTSGAADRRRLMRSRPPREGRGR